jgi:hypothetical protein
MAIEVAERRNPSPSVMDCDGPSLASRSYQLGGFPSSFALGMAARSKEQADWL